MRRLPVLLVIILLATHTSAVWGQRIVDKHKGDYNEYRKGIMDGNLVGTVYYNHGEVADWKNEPQLSGVWPKGTNHTYVDGVAMIVQAETKDSRDSVIHPLETNYYEYTRYDPSNGVTYGWAPLPGYAGSSSTTPAQSTDPKTWPAHWPDRTADWDGYWNGFFGKGIQNADLESYFVYDDNEDREYLLYPHFFQPDASDASRGGLGMQVHARGFQWSQVLAEDVIFWYYEITNMGTTDYPKTLFAQYVDWGIGGHDNSSNNAGDYNSLLNISYAWSIVPFGSPGNWSPIGYAGYAFLESPGISDDNIDNDHDGLTDERRDNNARVFIDNPIKDPFLRNVQQDTAQFSKFYGYSWKPHWDADENCNWRSFSDLNHNGKWDPGEPLNDDVGTDGLGPLDDGYPGPDPDGTEGNGKPDQGEPHFGFLDKDESDQLGLTGFVISAVHTYDLNDDEKNWKALSALPPPEGHSGALKGVNLANHFSSYLFHLNGRNTYSATTGKFEETGETERFSMALIFGMDLDDLFRRKRTVQQIYNANYQFAKPPDKPLVKAVAGNKKVTLYWDDRAEHTFDAFYQKFNFEGYRIYRSTEPNFLEDRIITDAFGKATYRKPIAQFDLIDGIKGLHPIDVNGALFNLGDDTGLQHSYVDTDVQNGQTYYYAVCAYDQGFTTTTVTGQFLGIPPSETTSIVKQDINGQVRTDVNTAVVIPRAPAAGYVPASPEGVQASGPGTGNIVAQILNPDSVRDGHVYQMTFENQSRFQNNPTPFFRFTDLTDGRILIDRKQITVSGQENQVFDGVITYVYNDSTVDVIPGKVRWRGGLTNTIPHAELDASFGLLSVRYPADFELRFSNHAVDTSIGGLFFGCPPAAPVNFTIWNTTENRKAQFLFYDYDNNGQFTPGDRLVLVHGDSLGKSVELGNYRASWGVSIAATIGTPQFPGPGDTLSIGTTKPFRTGETYQFRIRAATENKALAKQQMVDSVAVVPNPYVGAASWEPATSSVGRGERRIYFIHLPRKCTIHIYTISGRLVQTLEHDSSMDNGQEPWNLVSRDGMDIAYGVYVYQVDAPGIGKKIDKFAVIK